DIADPDLGSHVERVVKCRGHRLRHAPRSVADLEGRPPEQEQNDGEREDARGEHTAHDDQASLPRVGFGFHRVQWISIGHFGSASRKERPYGLLRIRLSRMTTVPESAAERIRRPTPWRSLRMASGSEYCSKGRPPADSIVS